MIQTLLSPLFLFVVSFCLPASSALAQSRASGAGFDLTATDGIRFLADAGRYEATGNVQLVVGDWVVLADRIVASLDAQHVRMERLLAEGTVFVQSGTFKARAASLELRLQAPKVELRGAPVSVQMADDRMVTAGSLSFLIDAGELRIDQDFVLQTRGAVIAGGRASMMTVDGVLDALHVQGGVDVERDGFRAAAESLRLDRENNLILLEGAVVLQSGDVLLSGISATFDLESGAVNINNDTSGRVSGALRSQ
ncbi:MAG: LptA/OstA family protein [Alphaproteobacteria bacterium]|jgi:lipopolysaccharide export system protein LptA|nr:LptA/OstA family protein [Alphaproteobacteria bacterium]